MQHMQMSGFILSKGQDMALMLPPKSACVSNPQRLVQEIARILQLRFR